MKTASSLFTVLMASLLAGCSSSSGNGTIEDVSVSGAAASSVGAVLGASSASGTLSFNQQFLNIFRMATVERANASGACPTVVTANGAGCTNSGSNAQLTYSSCSFGSSTATWSGIVQVSLGSGTVSCGTFPTVANTTLNRQFVTSGGVPSTMSRTSSGGTLVTLDHTTANLGNYQGDTIAANIGSGYGSQVTFSGSARNGVTIAERIYGTLFDHSVTGSVSVSESGSTRTVSGTVTTYHNKIKMKGTTTFTNVVYNNTCCQPISGTVSTTFAKTSASPSNIVTNAVQGATETLTITGCGTGSLSDYSGNTLAVSVNTCY